MKEKMRKFFLDLLICAIFLAAADAAAETAMAP